MTRRNPSANAERIKRLLQENQKEYYARYLRRDYKGALAIANQATKWSNAPDIAASRALCMMRLGRHEEALAICKKLPAEKLGIDFADLMTELNGHLGNVEETRNWGNRVLGLKDQAVSGERVYAIPSASPPAFTRGAPNRNIISFSLFGSKACYCETAIMNCEAAARLMPDWTCRFYIDETVPEVIRERLVAGGGDVVFVDAETRERVHPLMWRFLAADDPSVERFLMRDADSLIGQREQAAVEAWIASGKWFHLIRDYFSHSELLLAGLWGGCRGVFPEMQQMMRDFIAAGRYSKTHLDQEFLRKCIWPTVRQNVLSHDNEFGFLDSEALPHVDGVDIEKEQHIGSNMSLYAIGGATPIPDGGKIRWTLLDEQGREVCSYTVTVTGGQWRENIPNSYIEKIEQKIWTVRTEQG